MTPVSLSGERCLLSVVIIARNEGSTIHRCIESVLRECKEIDSEVILVDSASTDDTVDRAREYPVRVARLGESRLLSPAVGRYVGSGLARGQFVLFLDGDMVLVEGWLREALGEFSREDLGGLCGVLYNVLPGESPSLEHPLPLPIGDVGGLGGGAIYRAAALKHAGTFNPSMRGEEERELAHRLRRCGYAVHRADVPMAHHFLKERTTAELDEKSSYFTGVGQVLRSYPFEGIFWDLLRANAGIIGILTALPLAVVSVVLATAAWGFQPLLWGGAAFGAAAVTLGTLVGWKRARRYFRSQVFIGLNVLRGVATGVVAPEEYMEGVVVVTDPAGRS